MTGISNIMPPMNTTMYTPNGQPYTATNAGKIIGGTIGTVAGLSSTSNQSVMMTTINTAAMTALGACVGAAFDAYTNQQRAKIVDSVNYIA